MTHMHEYTRIYIYLEESGAVLTYSACVYTQQFASCAWYMIETSTEGEGSGGVWECEGNCRKRREWKVKHYIER